jgi:hypothetical protein
LSPGASAGIIEKLDEINAGPSRSHDQGAADPGSVAMPITPVEFRKVIGDETEKWAKVVKFSRAKPD